jgi:two-component system chemotaxis sensor kinase CheA
MVVDPLLAEPLALFVAEAEGYVQAANECLLALERGDGDPARRHQQLARLLHTLKGTAATFGLAGLSDAAHRMESAAELAREAPGPMPAQLADALLRCLDGFLATLRACAAGREEPAYPPALLAALGAQRTQRDAAPPAALLDPDPPDAPELASWPVQAGDIAAFTREIEHLRDLQLRIDARARELARVLETAESLLEGPRLRPLRARLADLRGGLAGDAEETAEVIAALDDGVKRICTLPVRAVLDPLHRAVRDLCRASGRRARLSIIGGDAVLDRRLLDALRGPLVQLVRNAVDHGVEPPEARRAAAKDPEAQIVITVAQQGNLVFIIVADDGAGIDRAAVGAAAVARGLVTRELLAAMSEPEVDRLVFLPGLSTRAEVSEVSGRGVGLDVVLEEVRALDGWIDVQTTPGQGTRFTIHMPMEIGSSWLLVVGAGGGQYGVPLGAIETLVAAREAAMRVSRRHMLLEHQEALIPIVDLGWLLGVRERKAPAAGQPLLILQAEGRRIALAVDQVAGEQDLVVRALPPELRALPEWQGAATLARGDFLLVLRPEWMVRQDARAEQVVTRRVLVADDSVTARALHRSVLESGGYTVHAVPSGEQALQQLSDTVYDVVISDVTMAPGGLDGIELLARIRATPMLARLPVILVSVAEDRELRARALALGADAYLTKKECASGRLLGEVAVVLSRRRAG